MADRNASDRPPLAQAPARARWRLRQFLDGVAHGLGVQVGSGAVTLLVMWWQARH